MMLNHPVIDVNIQDNNGQTALIMASDKGYDTIVQQLLKTKDVDVNIQDKLLHTALINASFRNHETIVKLLLENNDVDVNIQDNNGSTALIYAANEKHDAIVEQLLKNNDIDVNIQDTVGNTALIYASYKGYIKIVRLLLQNNDIDINIQDENGNTAMTHATIENREKIVELLEKHHIKLTTKYIDNGKILKFNPLAPEDKNFCSDKERLKTDDIFIFNINKTIYCYSREELKLIKEGLLENKLSKYQLQEIDDILEEYECNNDVDPITQESVSAIPKDRLSYLEVGGTIKNCYDNFAISEYIKTNKPNPLNPITRQPIKKENIQKIHRRNKLLELFKD